MSLRLMVPPSIPSDTKAALKQYQAQATEALKTGVAANGFPANVDAWIGRLQMFSAITEKNHLAACSASPQAHAEAIYACGPKLAFVYDSIMTGAAAALEHQTAVVNSGQSRPEELARRQQLLGAITKAQVWHTRLINQQRVEPWQSIH